MRNIYLFLSILCLILFTSKCTKELPSKEEHLELLEMTFSAYMEKPIATKTIISEPDSNRRRKIFWMPDDSIGVVPSGYNAVYTLENTYTSISDTAMFKGNLPPFESLYAFYPFSKNLSYSDGGFNFTLSSTQNYADLSFAKDSYPMISVIEEDDSCFNFKNIFGLLALNLKGDENISSIIFSAKDSLNMSVPISGEFRVTFDSNNIPVANCVDGQKTVCIDCGSDGVALSPDSVTTFFIVLPCGLYSSFNLIITTSDGDIMFKEATKPLNIVRSSITPTAPLQYEELPVMDLSEIETANCYIAYGKGHYKFDASVIGNGAAGLVSNSYHASNVSITPSSVSLLWEDKEGLIQYTLYDSSTKEISFVLSENKGNALIAAKNSSGTIIWSWHIWATDEISNHTYINKDYKQYIMMDKNLGAISSDRGVEADDWKLASGMMYQWGRKDPFIREYSTIASEKISVKQSIYEPTLIGGETSGSWTSSSSSNLWHNSKTIYDPCPPGYRVPIENVWTNFTVGEGTVNSIDSVMCEGEYNYGFDFIIDWQNTSYYPETGDGSSNFEFNGRGGYWSSSYGVALTFRKDSLLSVGIQTQEIGKLNAVRCMVDTSYTDPLAPEVQTDTVVVISSTSAKVSGTVKSNGTYLVTERGFIYGKENKDEKLRIGNNGVTKLPVEGGGVGEFDTIITNLKGQTTYYVRAYALNVVGVEYGDILQFKTGSSGDNEDVGDWGDFEW